MELLIALLLIGFVGLLIGFAVGLIASSSKFGKRASSAKVHGPYKVDGAQSTMVVVTQDEWLHLCARRRIRLNHYRLVNVVNGRSSLREAFSLAPFTKPADGSALLVLYIRAQWLNTCVRDPDTSSVGMLELDDVLSHHLVSEQDKVYLARRAESVGVNIDSKIYSPQWVDWDSSRLDADARYTADALAKRLGRPIDGESRWPPLRSAWFSGTAEPQETSPSIIERLIAVAGDLNERSLGNRDGLAYCLQVAILWAERHGYHPRAGGPLSEDLRLAYEASRQVSWDNAHDAAAVLGDTFNKLSDACPTAFTDEVSPFVVAVITRIICDANDEQLSPDAIIGFLQSTPSSSFPLVALVAVHAMSVERINQFLLVR